MSSDDRTGSAPRTECPECGAVFGTALVRGLTALGTNGLYGRFDCPACGAQVTLPEDD
ncbi:hypothetical protein [Halopelagius longus]|uniref:Uncharacterized protein n=1 Tax=Halopelagius longus TaxID=1236180 RepID=A0A1H1GEI9_9EURY|nr:hypothetical protein [Halopelagius longus]SDR11702.1 hypothetical protein SAMN05216278_3626 [Halopelagius longus]